MHVSHIPAKLVVSSRVKAAGMTRDMDVVTLSRVRKPATLDRYAMCRAPVAQSDRARDF